MNFPVEHYTIEPVIIRYYLLPNFTALKVPKQKYKYIVFQWYAYLYLFMQF